MGSRLELQDLLETIIGNQNVYFNPPESLIMNYPGIKYNISKIPTLKASNKTYKITFCYSVTLMSTLPNEALLIKMLNLPMCSFDRHYTSDGLNHDVLQLYF